MPRVLSFLVLTGVLSCPWAATAQTPPTSCSVTSQNLWVRDQLNTYYYWYQFMPAGVNAANFTSPEAYLEAVRYRPIDNAYSFIGSAAASDSLYNDSQSISLGIVYQLTSTEMRVVQVYPDSPAAEAGFVRGDRITHLNGQTIGDLVATGTFSAALGANEAGVTVTVGFQRLSGGSTQVVVAKRLINIPSVSLTRVVEVNGRRVGYINFKTFVRPSVAALNEAFQALRAAGATELVLDLRYNGGGLVDVAAHLAGLIGGARTDGQVLFNYVHNNKVGSQLDKTTRFEKPADTLDLQRLVVITTRSSASASELVINALRPFIPVVVIGDTTYGKPVGQYGLTFCEKILFPVAFTIRNANNEGDYFDGIVPTCAATDDITRPLGDVEEASFAEALAYIRTGECTARATAARALRADPAIRLTGWAAILNTW